MTDPGSLSDEALLAALNGGASAAPAPAARPARPRASRPQIQFSDDRDAIIRTVLGEAAAEPPEGQRAVAAVVMNRARNRNMTPQQVVLERNQFEPWGNPDTARRLAAVRPDDPAYLAAAEQVDRALAGDNPVGDADHFFAPKAQAAMGRDVPSWARGTPTVIGGHNFYSLGGSTEDVRQTAAAMPDDVEGLSDEALLAALQGDQTAPAASPSGYELPPGVLDYEALSPEELSQLKKGTRLLAPANAPGEARQIVTLAQDLSAPTRAPIMGEEQQQFGGLRTFTPGIADAVGGFVSGAAEQVPLLDEAVTAADAALTGRSFSQSRDEYRAMQEGLNSSNREARVAGGVAGFGATLLAPGAGLAGQWINAGNRVQKLGRAGLLGSVGGAAFSAANTEGGFDERAEAGRNGALFGFGAGAIGQRAIGALDGLAARAANRAPTDARLLSRMGVDLTAGQMAGGLLKRVEDGMTSIPILGDAIRGAQRRTLESFDNTAINRALEPIGATLDASQSAGRGGMVNARAAERAAYTQALTGVSVDAADQALTQSLTGIRRAQGLTKDVRSSLNSTLDNILEQAQGVIDGDTWKRVDSQLAAAARAAGKGADSAPEKAVLRDRLSEARVAWRDLLGRTDQAALEAVSNADAASAALRIVRKASSDVGSAARGGDASPATLNRAVAAGGSDGGAGYAQGSRLLQDLTDPAMRVLPSSVPDSGTPLRSLLSVGTIGGGATVAGANPAVPAAIIAGLGIASTAYGKTAQSLANKIYRSRDGAVQGKNLKALAELASQRPALIPYYEAVAASLRPDAPSQSQTSPQGQPGLLSPVPAA